MMDKVKAYLNEQHFDVQNKRVLLGVSGGADSMVLLDVLQKLGVQCWVAHMNFSLRGVDSDDDEAFVRDYCLANDLPFFAKKVDTLAFASAHKMSMEMAARELRYTFFNQLMDEHKLDYLAVGHHQNDLAETMLINLSRGTGLKGLSGIKFQSGKVIRPLLSVQKHEIENYAQKNHIAFRIDASNSDVDIIRNRVRHQVIPEFQMMNPSFTETLNLTAKRLEKIQNWLDVEVESFKKKHCQEDSEVLQVSITALKNFVEPELLLFELIYPFGFNSAQIQEMNNALSSQSGKQWISETSRVVRSSEALELHKFYEKKEAFCIEIHDDQACIEEPIRLQLERLHDVSLTQLIFEKHMAYFDADKLAFPLQLRSWKQGDRFVPFGMKGSKKLSDFMIDQKFSLLEKEKLVVLCSGEDIIWVVNHRSDNRYRIDSKTKNVLKVTFQK